MNDTIIPTDVALPKTRKRRRGIQIIELPDFGFEELIAHDVDVKAEMLSDSTLSIDIEQINGPRRGLSANLTIAAVPPPWWMPWMRPRLMVKAERDS